MVTHAHAHPPDEKKNMLPQNEGVKKNAKGEHHWPPFKWLAATATRTNSIQIRHGVWMFYGLWAKCDSFYLNDFFPFLVKLLRAVTSFWLSVNGKLLIRRTTFLIWVDYSNNELSSQNTLCRHWLFSDNNLKADVQLWRTTITTTVARFHFSFWLFIFHSICWCDATKWRKWK